MRNGFCGCSFSYVLLLGTLATIPAWLISVIAFGVAMWVDGRLGVNALISRTAQDRQHGRLVVGAAHCDVWVMIRERGPGPCRRGLRRAIRNGF
jgi:hypothetical protein